ncbi:MAG: hypothetical protein ABI555_00665, partial [Chloroflexota bacterium]
ITPANLLLLDEPTNHLDVGAREAIEAFLRDSSATILVVSHDRRFLETVCDRLWVVDGGQIVAFEGGYRAWRDAVSNGWTVAAAAALEQRRLHPAPATSRVRGARKGEQEPVASPESSPPAPPTSNGAKVPPATRTPRGPRLSKDAYRRQRETVDSELTRLGLRKNHLELATGDPSVQANYVELRRITSELADVEAALAVAEDAWLALEERAP